MSLYQNRIRIFFRFVVDKTTFISFNREKAGVELGGGSYLIHKVYDDEETLRLVAATCETLGKRITYVYLQ